MSAKIDLEFRAGNMRFAATVARDTVTGELYYAGDPKCRVHVKRYMLSNNRPEVMYAIDSPSWITDLQVRNLRILADTALCIGENLMPGGLNCDANGFVAFTVEQDGHEKGMVCLSGKVSPRWLAYRMADGARMRLVYKPVWEQATEPVNSDG